MKVDIPGVRSEMKNSNYNDEYADERRLEPKTREEFSYTVTHELFRFTLFRK